MASASGGHGQLTLELTRCRLDGDSGVGLLVRIDPDYDHSWSPFLRWPPTTGRQRTGLSGGVKPRSYQVTLALLGQRRATQRMQVKPLRPTATLRVSPPPAPSLTGTSVAASP